MLELVTNFLEFKFNGEDVKMRFVNTVDAELLPEDNDMGAFRKLYTSLGMKKEIFDKLELDHVLVIAQHLTSKKK